MVNKLTTTLGLVLLSSSFALAAHNAAPPTTTPQGNAVTAPQSGWTTGIKTRTHHHGGKKHHKHHKHQKSPVTKK